MKRILATLMPALMLLAYCKTPNVTVKLADYKPLTEIQADSIYRGVLLSDTATTVRIQRPFSGGTFEVSLEDLLNNRIILDTLVIAGEEVIIRDSVLCPPALVRDSLVYVERTHYLPGKQHPVVFKIDTVYRSTVQEVKVPQTVFVEGNNNTWMWLLGAVVLLIAALWRAWKSGQKK